MRTMRLSKVVSLSLAVAMAAGTACAADKAADEVALKLPPGFKATVFYEGQGTARHIAIAASGDVYINGRNPGLVALRENDPVRWLEYIVLLRQQGRAEDADAELARFRARYPDVPIPDAAKP